METKEQTTKEYRLKFKGNKAEIYRQLKSFCSLSDKTVNGTVIEAIELYLKQTKN
jgi:hypothetical protein